MSEIELSGEAAVVANKIRTLDREFDKIEQEREESITRGMRAPLTASIVNKWGQDRSDERYRSLLEERVSLVDQLKALVGDGRRYAPAATTRLVSTPARPGPHHHTCWP